MKLVVAVVRPFTLNQIVDALAKIGIHELTVTEVKGSGREQGHPQLFRGTEYPAQFLPMLKVEIAVPGHDVQKVVEAIAAAARTGRIGDGKIIVCQLDRLVIIIAGDAGEPAPPLAA
jgi:nitrogen regulatory protein P-II 2